MSESTQHSDQHSDQQSDQHSDQQSDQQSGRGAVAFELPNNMTLPSSAWAREVLEHLTELQGQFREGLNSLSERFGDHTPLVKTEWLRDEGAHGGGWRWGLSDAGLLNQGSLNVSCVQYDDLPNKRLSSATALSCIVHPEDPRAPSLHTHISWTELRDGEGGGWRLMADLNPSLPSEADRAHFQEAMEALLSELPEAQRRHAFEQGDRYFYIPSLERHRGVSHVYLEQLSSGEDEASKRADLALARRFGEGVIKSYLSIVERALERVEREGEPRDELYEAQLAYHSAYFLQVLTLDRGTSSGLLIHNQNDEGILGSLPQRVLRPLLCAWVERQAPLLADLLQSLIDTLPDEEVVTLTPELRRALAQTSRAYFSEHPEALGLQARGDVLPPTVAHHAAPPKA